jgi:hypothetical protein
MHKTTDGGSSWTNYSSGIVGYVYDIAVDSINPDIIYAITPAGAYKTTDGGTNWTDTGTMNGKAVIINPHDNNIVYAGTGTGVYKSTSGGGGWIAMNDGLDNTDVTCLDVSANYLYASTDGAGVYKWDIQVGITEEQKQTETSLMLEIYPSIIRETATIKLHNLNSELPLSISIYDVQGRLVKNLSHEQPVSVTQSVVWDGRDFFRRKVPTGVYLLKFCINEKIIFKKLIVIR